jgi:hypothetical protein
MDWRRLAAEQMACAAGATVSDVAAIQGKAGRRQQQHGSLTPRARCVDSREELTLEAWI